MTAKTSCQRQKLATELERSSGVQRFVPPVEKLELVWGPPMGLTALFKGKSYQDEELLSVLKQNRSKSEFIRTAPDLKTVFGG